MYKKILFLFSFLSIILLLKSQNQTDTASNFVFTRFYCGFDLPQNDLAGRFGQSSSIGIGCDYKTQNHFLFSFQAAFIFGSNVKSNYILNGLRDSYLFDETDPNSGGIIDQNGKYSDVRLFQRGFYSFLKFGKIFPAFATNPNSGFYCSLGLGVLQHKIHIDAIGKATPQLSENYLKGYDRLSNGFALSQNIGYMYYSRNRLINFFIDFQLIEAFTQNRRQYNYDMQDYDKQPRTDVLSSIRFGWVLPIYTKQTQEFYYY